MTVVTEARSGLALSGLNGANPLAFLAALGTIASLRSVGHTEVRLGWIQGLTWVPRLHIVGVNDEGDLADLLVDVLRGKAITDEAEEKRNTAERAFQAAKKAVNDKRNEIKDRGLRGKDRKAALQTEVTPLEEEFKKARHAWLGTLKDAVSRPELAIGKHIDCNEDEYREHAFALLAGAGHEDREPLDLVAAFGSDASLNKSGRITATPFCFITGSGHQYFLDTVRQLMLEVTAERIHAALFRPWTYDDEKLSLRWDPLEDRRYALMDRDPTASDNKARTVWMANLLAYRALALFPSAPRARRLATTAWIRDEGRVTFTWPIWEQPAGPDTICSLLQLSELTSSKPDRAAFRARGVVDVFRARRIQVGTGPLHKINFSPSRSI